MGKVFVSRVNCVTPPRTRRTLMEALLARAPWLYRVIGDIIMHTLPPCRLRRAIVRRNTVSGWAAISRCDYDVTFARYMRDVDYEADGGFQTLGLTAKVRGRDELIASLREWSESWEWWGLEPCVVMDMGDTLLGLGRFKARGLTSGVDIDRQYAQLIAIRPGTGMVMRERDFMDWRQGLLAAGLEPERFAGLLESISEPSLDGDSRSWANHGRSGNSTRFSSGTGAERTSDQASRTGYLPRGA